ncbi:hypothetical protein PVAND_013743 [Polypedilum vanderplanki]|uniref:Sodium/calcium exchanger membrane region domain-containing protein n=1 Tax=Polypedilum vanderplanki TaxID=319348 RepID=A0A9J6CQB3_POLVA|nr:hypothetical protein PVAND_013743 [Polypedilum vanderplanki]
MTSVLVLVVIVTQTNIVISLTKFPTSVRRKLLAITLYRDAYGDDSNFTQTQQHDVSVTTMESDKMQEERAIPNFIPSEDKQYRIDELKIKHELAAGTIMVMATSSPELCINCVSTFITDGDIGIGTIVGSTVFNVLVVTACCGFFAYSAIKVDVFLLSRDCFFYALSIVGLIVVIYDHQIVWHEAALMLAGYFIYLACKLLLKFLKSLELNVDSLFSFVSVMYSSDLMSKKMRLVAQNIKIQFLKVSGYAHNNFADELTEITPLFKRIESLDSHKYNYISCNSDVEVKLSEDDDKFNHHDECATSPWKLPKESNILIYIMRWPITFILWCSIPDCRIFGNFYILSFINCVAWILSLSYLIASMLTNVDSIMGMIFLGGCTSMPDAVYSIMAAMKGNADVGLSNAISANIYDILLCLGLPWSARTLIVPLISGQPSITLKSTGITYSAISLIATLAIFYILLSINRFKLDKKTGVICVVFYVLFLIFTFLLELDLPIPINFITIVSINGLI